MAIIKVSGLLQGIKGKLQGSIFQFGSGGNVMRNNRGFSKQKGTAWQDQKVSVQLISTSWRELDQEDRDAWVAATGEWPTVNKWGDARTPSGYELYMRMNLGLIKVGLTPIVTPPVVPTFPDYGNNAFIGSISDPLIYASDAAYGAFVLDVFACPMMSTGRKSPRTGYIYMKSFTDDSVEFYNFNSEYVARFGAKTVGYRVYIMVRYRSASSGTFSTPIYLYLDLAE